MRTTFEWMEPCATRLVRVVVVVVLLTGAACRAGSPPPTTSPPATDSTTAVDHSAHTAEAPATAPAQAAVAETDGAGPSDEAPTGWFCPMHPDVTSTEPGTCQKCSMKLIAGNPFDTREYSLDVSTSPAAIQPGVPFILRLSVRHPGTGKTVRVFEEVHEKRFHLFLISQDMTEFQHLHPELTTDGTWTMEVTVQKPGYYRVLGDFLPTGGSPQFLGRTLVTAGYDGDMQLQAPRLVLDASEKKTVGTIAASVALEDGRLIAGEYGHFTFTLTDANTGEPVTDLQPYLGAFGHMLVLSEDMRDVVHSHPSTDRPGTDISTGAGGPEVAFEGYLPRPGLYKAWTQFLRHDQLVTLSYTFKVLSLDEAYLQSRTSHPGSDTQQ